MSLPHPPDNTTISPSELHLLFVLLDSNLPTGGFVSSSGLEAYAKHGFLSTPRASLTSVPPASRIVDYATQAVRNYASSSSAFAGDSWRAVERLSKGKGKADLPEEQEMEQVLDEVKQLDDLYEAMTLNHVTRRSSTAQGIALLTLLAKGFSVPSHMDDALQDGELADSLYSVRKRQLVNRFRKAIRKGEVAGHLPICWGLLANASGLAIDRTIHLHLFLHARSLLSSAVRLNLIGPYASAQLLLHPLRIVIERESSRHLNSTTGVIATLTSNGGVPDAGNGTTTSASEDDWSWADDDDGPAMTWPLGELLMGRHDMQHTRIFNS